MLKGSLVALVTPFKDGKIDEEKLKGLVEFHIREGTHGIVPCGTTGESATLSYEEHERVINIVIKTVNKRAPVVAGTGSNSTDEAIRLTIHAKEAGADAALLITPYYNKPNQEGLYRHYRTIAEAAAIPIVLYNVPGRTSVNMLPSTVARLAEIENIIAIKEASGSLQQVSEIIYLCKDKITVISGDDFNTLPIMAVGGKGVISVTANIVPGDIADMCNRFENGDMSSARKLHYKLLNLHKAMFYETNPIPVKTALHLMGKISGELRLPLTAMPEDRLDKLKEAMTEYGL